MTSSLHSGSRWAVLGVALFAVAAIELATARAPALALVNESPSVPRGLYLRAPGAVPGPGDLVALAQPATSRAYLGGLGMPSDVLLLKRVAAAEGMPVCRRGNVIEAGDRRVGVRTRDGRGVVLPAWAGCRRLGAGEVFLLGDTPGSFDSRYFGPVRVSDLDGVFWETLTW